MDSCLNCTKRYPGCHDTCDNHKNQKKKREKANDNYRKFMDGLGWDATLRFQMKRG